MTMAETAASLAKDLREEFLTCSLCLTCFSRPKMLPCQHVFCTRCLHKWYESKSKENGAQAKTVTCPMCRVSQTVPASGILGFPDSHAMTSLMNFLDGRVESTASWGPTTIGLIREFGVKGSQDGQLYKPLGIAISAETGEFFVTDCKNRIQVFDNDGVFVRKFTFPQLAKKFTPTHLTMTKRLSSDGKECLLVSDVSNKQVLVCSLGGEILMRFGGNELGMPGGVAITKDGSLHVVDMYARVVRTYNRSGQEVRSFGGLSSSQKKIDPNTEADECVFRSPTHIAVTRADILLVSDSQSHLIYIFDSDGGYRNKFNSIGKHGGQLQCPSGIAIDNSGNILVADTSVNSVQLFDYRGRFRNRVDDSFDGLRNPQGMAIVNDEHVAVVDTDNHAVKLFSYL
ncbi:tripartite motif-containing protein 3 [Strongylocentrotus purpuratus]|uniref:RING-type domain-containing protein n=1 Tax=Strongylocentrotus purpuratus TaxID=7668 RepID=A0A7M7GFT5_STRPU|nr:tripartite motif-containing protein 3 [Strongylocentrotus purpuratus]